MRRYRDTIVIPDHITLGGLDAIIDRVREVGAAEMTGPRTLAIEIDALDDWDLRELLDEVERDLAALEILFQPAKGNVSDRPEVGVPVSVEMTPRGQRIIDSQGGGA